MRVLELTGLKPNGGTVRRLAVAAQPEGHLLAVVEGTPSACYSVRWLNLADGREVLRKDLSGGDGDPVPALSPDLKEFAYFERDGDSLNLYLERAQKGPAVVRRPFAGVEDEEGERYYAIAFAPGGKFLQACTDGCTRGWDLTEGLTGRLDRPIPSTFCISEGGATGEFLAIAPSNLSVLSDSSGNCSLVNEDRNDWAGGIRSRSGGPVRGLTFSPDGRLLCVAAGRAVAVYEIPARSDEDDEEGAPTLAYTLKGHKAAAAVAFSPDGSTLATADEQGVIRLWDAATGKEKAGSARDWKVGKVGALVFSPDGCTCVAGGEGGRLVVWDLEPDEVGRVASLKIKARNEGKEAEEETQAESAASPLPGSAPLLFWDFENTMSVKKVSISAGIPTDPKLVSGFVSQTGGGPAERWDSAGTVFLIRRFGTQELFAWLTVNRPVLLTGVTFRHFHNHNPGYPTERGYRVQLQIAAGDGADARHANLGKPLVVNNGNSGHTATIAVEHRLQPGGYRLRWLPKGLTGGTDTSSEFFALKDLRLDGVVVEEEQPAEAAAPKKGRKKGKPAKEEASAPAPQAAAADKELADLQARATPCPRCGKARRALRVRKEGPNKGRLFLACSDRACDSFEWAASAGKKRGKS